MTDKKIVCVDSCVFISYLKGDDPDRTTEEKTNLNGFFSDFIEGKIHVIFPTFERVEILACELPDGAMKIFQDFIDRPNFDEVPTSTAIAEVAAEIRNENAEKRRKHSDIHRISTPDAVVLATAAIHGCSIVYTFDGASGTKKDRKLLSFDSLDLAGYVLHIKRPESSQTEIIWRGGAGGN